MKIVNQKPDAPEMAHCEKHGAYEIRYTDYILDGKYFRADNCPKCAKEESDAHEVERLRKARERAGLKPRHFQCSFENYQTSTPEQAKALNDVQEYLTKVVGGRGCCLIMSGRVGTGKTHLGAALINSFITVGRSSRLIKMLDLLREVKSSWNKSSKKNEQELIEYFSNRELLVIDEIGVQFGSDNEKLIISDIIDNRYQAMLPTVLISNMDSEGIKKLIGERSFDRLRQDGGKIVAFKWDSARRSA